MCQANKIYFTVRQDCGPARPIPVDCGDPLCTECEQQRAVERRAHWLPVLKAMRRPAMITFTIKTGPELKERIVVFQKSFRRLFDLRLGPRAFPRDEYRGLRSEAVVFVWNHLSKLFERGEIGQAELHHRYDKWRRSLDRFHDRVQAYHVKHGKWPRVRDVVGPGFASLEITLSNGLWHVHRHLCIDSKFIPWPLLVAAWLRATQGQGEIVDIREIDKRYNKSIKEVAKYLTKPWEIPQEKRAEFRSAVRGIKRIWPLGGAKPVEPERACPFCGQASCHARPLGQGEEYKRGIVGDTELMALRMLDDNEIMYFAREPGKAWRSIPVDLIPKEFACHSLMTRGP